MIFLSRATYAQQTWAVAINSNGVLMCKYYLKQHSDSMKSTGIANDTISVADAQSIFALNILNVDREKLLSKLKVKNFQMTIINGDERKDFKCNSEILTTEMHDALMKVKTGSNLYFQYITGITEEGYFPSVEFLPFYVK